MVSVLDRLGERLSLGSGQFGRVGCALSGIKAEEHTMGRVCCLVEEESDSCNPKHLVDSDKGDTHGARHELYGLVGELPGRLVVTESIRNVNRRRSILVAESRSSIWMNWCPKASVDLYCSVVLERAVAAGGRANEPEQSRAALKTL